MIISLVGLQLVASQCAVPTVCDATGIVFRSGLDDSLIKESGLVPAVQVNTVGFSPAFTPLTFSPALIISDEAQITGTVANQKRYFTRIIDVTCLPKYAYVYCKSSSAALTKLYINGILYPHSHLLCNERNFGDPSILGGKLLRFTRFFLIGKNIIEWEVSNGNIENKLANPIGLVYEIKLTST